MFLSRMETNSPRDRTAIPSVSEQQTKEQPHPTNRRMVGLGSDGLSFIHNRKLMKQSTNKRFLGRIWSQSQRYECAYCDFDVYDLLGCTDVGLVVNLVHHETAEHGQGKDYEADEYRYRELRQLYNKERLGALGGFVADRRDEIAKALVHWDGPPIFDGSGQDGQVDEIGEAWGGGATGLEGQEEVHIDGALGGSLVGTGQEEVLPIHFGESHGGATTRFTRTQSHKQVNGGVKEQPLKGEPSKLTISDLDFGVSELLADNGEILEQKMTRPPGILEVEDVKAKARVKYIDSIDDLNDKIGERTKSYNEKLALWKQKRDNLKSIQVLEMKAMNKKHKENKINLKKVYEERQKKLTRDYEEESDNMDIKYQEDREKLVWKHAADEASLNKVYKDDEDKDYSANLKKMRDELATDLQKLDLGSDNSASSSDKSNLEAARETLECPVCLELMKPPTRIWMCPTSHIICESCKNKLKGRICPTCRNGRVAKRAFMAENFARSIFNRFSGATEVAGTSHPTQLNNKTGFSVATRTTSTPHPSQVINQAGFSMATGTTSTSHPSQVNNQAGFSMATGKTSTSHPSQVNNQAGFSMATGTTSTPHPSQVNNQAGFSMAAGTTSTSHPTQLNNQAGFSVATGTNSTSLASQIINQAGFSVATGTTRTSHPSQLINQAGFSMVTQRAIMAENSTSNVPQSELDMSLATTTGGINSEVYQLPLKLANTCARSQTEIENQLLRIHVGRGMRTPPQTTASLQRELRRPGEVNGNGLLTMHRGRARGRGNVL